MRMSTKAERRKTKDWTGQHWGSLVALKYVAHGVEGARWRFQCDCGHRGTYYLKQVQRGERATCGCDTKPVPLSSRPVVRDAAGDPLSPVWREAATVAKALQNERNPEQVVIGCRSDQLRVDREC
jgi:hypothetical protein